MTLTIGFYKGRPIFEVEGTTKEVEKTHKIMDKLIKKGKKNLELSKKETLMSIISVLTTTGNEYLEEDFLSNIWLKTMGLNGMKAVLEFKEPNHLKNLCNELF